jgi:ATP phosphoribosyltransferase
MRIAAPSLSSKLHHPALGILRKHFDLPGVFFKTRPNQQVGSSENLGLGTAPGNPNGNRCLHRSETQYELVFCRGSDIPNLVGIGVVDLGLAGYDMAVESYCKSGNALDIRHFGPIRPSFVCYATLRSSKADRIARIYSEYEQITRHWAANTLGLKDVPIVPVHGSSEGLLATDQDSAAVLLVTTGETLRANGDFSLNPLLATDLCLISRPGVLSTLSDNEVFQQLTRLPYSPALVALSSLC